MKAACISLLRTDATVRDLHSIDWSKAPVSCSVKIPSALFRVPFFVLGSPNITLFMYHTGYPKDLGPSRVIHFTTEREFVQLLHQGHPVVVSFTIRGNYTKHLDRVLEEAAIEFYPHVECPKYPGFCMTRQRKEYPFTEMFHSPEQAASQGRVADPNTTKYSVKVLPFNYDLSPYGFREFFKRHGIQSSDPK
ncbi:uncharacterized protein LOC132279545 isoform X2 [Cornus florida]|uniref:uncharacterized protein LOC132279545 isoform X2 n=1 Tax=Cornus florida TaxID=4283 RepID=UPI0028A26201|nr:uncharacterized protein LOC132279545 isoform X2 [Cornus florida]